MQFPQGNNMTRVKASNQSAILRTIYYYGPINRADIAKRLDLTLPTVTTNVNRMLEKGMIKEYFVRNKVSGASGRHARPLVINPEAFYFCGVEMKDSRLSVCVTNFCGEILAAEDSRYEDGVYENFIRQIAGAFKRCLAASGKKAGQLSGVGISMPGMVDRENGILKINSRFQWFNKEVSRDFAKLTGYAGKITLENNAIARGMSAQLFNWEEMENEKSFAYLVVSFGIACPLFLNTSSYRGSVVEAGEVGHTVVEPHGRLCSCGNRGCLETYASEYAIIQECKEEMRQGRALILKEICADKLTPGIPEILRAQAAGDREVCRILESAVYMLSIAVRNIISFTNPDIMLIDGPLFQSEENKKQLLGHIQAGFCNAAYFKTVIRFVESDKNAGGLGSAAVAIDERLEITV